MNQIRRYLNQSGFTLVELIVVVAIIAVMSSAAIIGLGDTGDEMAVLQSATYIQDTIEDTKTKLLTDITSAEIRFLPGYLVIDESKGDKAPLMDLDHHCPAPLAGIAIKDSGKLTQISDLHGVIATLTIPIPQSGGQDFCFDFDSSSDTQRTFQLKDSQGTRTLRFVHFNLKRDKPGRLRLDTGTGDIRLTLSKGRRQYYRNGGAVTPPPVITLADTEHPTFGTILELR